MTDDWKERERLELELAFAVRAGHKYQQKNALLAEQVSELQAEVEAYKSGASVEILRKEVRELREANKLAFIPEMQDVLCLLSAIKSLEEEEFNLKFLEPKKKLAGRMAALIPDSIFDKHRTPKWLKQHRDATLRSPAENEHSPLCSKQLGPVSECHICTPAEKEKE